MISENIKHHISIASPLNGMSFVSDFAVPLFIPLVTGSDLPDGTRKPSPFRQQQYSICLVLMAFAAVSWAQESVVKTGNFLGGRGPYDSRPFKGTHLAESLIFGDDFFRSKNQRWIDEGFAFGGYVALNTQLGSEDSTLHGMSETLFIGAWEPLRKSNEAGRVVFGLAHDHTIGSLTTREFANRQGLVETPDDLDTSPDKTFTTLGVTGLGTRILYRPESRLGLSGRSIVRYRLFWQHGVS